MKARKRGLLSRDGNILDWTVDIYVRAEGTKRSRTRDSAQYMILEGELTEPLNGVTQFLLQLHPAEQPDLGARETPSLGAIIQVKPKIQVAGTLTPEEFRSLFLLAGSGKLRSCALVFQEPHYGHALVAGMSFSSRPPESE